MRKEGHDVGPPISESALQGLKEDLADGLGIVNDNVVVLHLWRDIPGEVFHSRILGGFFSEEMGRTAAMQWDMTSQFHQMDGETPTFDDRRMRGALLDFWRVILRQRWWILLVQMLQLLLAIMNPLLVVGHGEPIAHLFLNGLLDQLPRNLELRNGDKLPLSILKHRRVQSGMAPPTFPDFLATIGKLSIVATGPNPCDLSLFIGDVHLSRQFYQPTLSLSRRRVRYAIAFKAYVTHRMTASLTATSPPPKGDASARRALLENVKAQVEQLLEDHGLENLLGTWIAEMQVEEGADMALRGLHVVDGRLIRRTTTTPRRYPQRDPGSLARGAPNSEERMKQLVEFCTSAEKAILNQQPVFTGPGGCEPSSELFKQWLLSRGEGTSLLWSSNRYDRTPEAVEAVREQNKAIGEKEKERALKRRQEEAEIHGSHRRAVLLARFKQAALDALRGEDKNVIFANANRVMTCTECEAPDIAFGQNTGHRCTVKDEKVDEKKMIIGKRGAESHFDQHLRIFFLQDLVNYPGMMDFLTEEDLEKMGIYPTLAIKILTGANGSLPPGLDLSFVGDKLVWHRNDTEPRILFASALDVALRAMAEAQDVERDEKAKLMLGDIFSSQQSNFSNEKFVKSLVEAVAHNPQKVKVCIHTVEDCGMVTVRKSKYSPSHQMDHTCSRDKKSNKDEYQFLEVSKFVGLPYVVQRFCVYMALVEDKKDFKKLLMWA